MPINYVRTDYYLEYILTSSRKACYMPIYYDKYFPRNCYAKIDELYPQPPDNAKVVSARQNWARSSIQAHVQDKLSRQLSQRCKQGFLSAICVRNINTGEVFFLEDDPGPVIDIEKTIHDICKMLASHQIPGYELTAPKPLEQFVRAICEQGSVLRELSTEQDKQKGIYITSRIFDKNTFDYAIWLYPKLIEKMKMKGVYFKSYHHYREVILFYHLLCIASKIHDEVPFNSESHARLMGQVINDLNVGREAIKNYEGDKLSGHNFLNMQVLALFDWDISVSAYAMQFQMDEDEARRLRI